MGGISLVISVGRKALSISSIVGERFISSMRRFIGSRKRRFCVGDIVNRFCRSPIEVDGESTLKIVARCQNQANEYKPRKLSTTLSRAHMYSCISIGREKLPAISAEGEAVNRF